jgi:hypothetical protein
MSDKPEDCDPEMADRRVGYASPPYEYRWPKGYCPNPAGRPRKKTKMTDITPLNEFDRRVLAEALNVVAEIDGKPFTNLDKLLLQMRASDRPEDRKLLLARYEKALQADHAWRTQAVDELLAYKRHWGPKFAARRLAGQKLPKVYPDPDDIVILSPTEFKFLGPVTAEEAADWEERIKLRHVFIFVAEEILKIAGLFCPLEEDRQRYEAVRRAYYRGNRTLPRNLKKKYPVKFPPFKPPLAPPDWYFEEGE